MIWVEISTEVNFFKNSVEAAKYLIDFYGWSMDKIISLVELIDNNRIVKQEDMSLRITNLYKKV